MSPWLVETIVVAPWRVIERTATPVLMVAPRDSISRAMARATAAKSMMPVSGLWRAATPTAWGSISGISAAERRRRPGTPFSMPRRSSSSSGPSSLSSRAMMSLPQRSYGHVIRVAVGVEGVSALGAELGLETSRLVVDAGVDDAGVVARLVGGDLVFSFEDEDARVRRAVQQFAGRGEAEDAPADDDYIPGGLHQWIAGSGTPPAPWRKSKSQPWWAWVTCCGEQLRVAAGGRELSGHPGRTAGGEVFFRDAQVDAATRDVQRDEVARLDERQRASDEGLGRDVQDAGAVGGAGHAGVADPHHVADALLQQLLGDREHAPLRHARAAERAGIPKDEDRVGGDVQRRVVDAGVHVVVVLEDDRGARVGEQFWGGGGVLDDGSVGGEGAVEDRQAALLVHGVAQAGGSRRRCRRSRPAASRGASSRRWSGRRAARAGT